MSSSDQWLDTPQQRGESGIQTRCRLLKYSSTIVHGCASGDECSVRGPASPQQRRHQSADWQHSTIRPIAPLDRRQMSCPVNKSLSVQHDLCSLQESTDVNTSPDTRPASPTRCLALPKAASDLSKSKSLLCLAASSMAEIAGHTVHVDYARNQSYLVGSVAATSLLGTRELERCLPDRKLRLFVGSWNMNGQLPPARLAEFLLPEDIQYLPDLLAIGSQECMGEHREWEARLQETLGPSHVMFHSYGMGTLHLALFLRRDLIWFASMPEVDCFSTKPTSTFKTKGAVAICFVLFGSSFLFVNSHLTAHQDNSADRVRDLNRINAMLNLPRDLPIRKRHSDLTDNFDCVFWCGDLNFRLEQSREVILREVKDNPTSLLDFDQLNYLKNEGLIFKGYSENTITFPPTYKYDPGTNEFDTSSKQRVPSYTDRILFKCQKSIQINPLHYDSVHALLTSDHKPVWGMWEVAMKPGTDNIPLSGGLFNREVYLDGLRRRADRLQPCLMGTRRGQSYNKCLLQ